MKKLFLIFMVLIGFSSLASAAATTATMGNQNSSGVYRLSTDSDGTFTYASDSSIAYPYINVPSTTSTVNYTLAATDSGKIIMDQGLGSSTGGHKFILPRAAPGLIFTIVSAAKVSTTVDTVDTSDTIDYSISGTLLDAGDSIKSTAQAGDSVTLCSAVANRWSLCAMKAVWTDNSTN